MEQECYENDQERRAEEEISFQWTQLPVDIEFVLDDNTVTLEDLENIVPGVVLPLSPSAEKRVKVYLNKKLFARGELVALDDGKLAVEINKINNPADNTAGFSDAK